MATCSDCGESAVISTVLPYCKEHFLDYFESKVKRTIKEHNLVGRNDKIVVACSGGKDSTTALYLLNKWFGNVTALAVDEGIPGYRSSTISDLASFCSRNNIPLKTTSYRQAFGFSLHEALRKVKVLPCNVCGTLRRHLLNSAAKGFTKIATGHNLDDEAQSIMMNFFKGNLSLASRLGPVSGVTQNAGFVQRVKPLVFCTEKEVATYAFLRKFGIRFSECPHARISFRAAVRGFLNELELAQPGSKRRLVENFIVNVLPRLKETYSQKASLKICSGCGEPSSNEVCKACVYVRNLSSSQ